MLQKVCFNLKKGGNVCFKSAVIRTDELLQIIIVALDRVRVTYAYDFINTVV